MIEVCISTSKRKRRELLQTLVEGREKCLADGALLGKAKVALEARREDFSLEVFLDPSGETGYGVVGLTDRIRDIIGDTGAFIETAVVRYRGRFVCDGLIFKCPLARAELSTRVQRLI